MKIIGIIEMFFGIVLTIFHVFYGDVIGMVSAVMAFICGLVIVLINQE